MNSSTIVCLSVSNVFRSDKRIPVLPSLATRVDLWLPIFFASVVDVSCRVAPCPRVDYLSHQWAVQYPAESYRWEWDDGVG